MLGEKKYGGDVTLQPWFERAKLGIFVHWGIYAVRGIPESWSFFNGQISYDDYMNHPATSTARPLCRRIAACCT